VRAVGEVKIGTDRSERLRLGVPLDHLQFENEARLRFSKTPDNGFHTRDSRHIKGFFDIPEISPANVDRNQPTSLHASGSGILLIL
jgi:hypothetical protein